VAFRIVILPSAFRDIDEIHAYIARNTGPLTADGVVDGIETLIAGLVTSPGRGNIPKELAAMGRGDYRELHFKPYRIFYRVLTSVVEVTAVLDGRRDMTTLLQHRLTR
jgi:toxin ParE1/3/4